MGTRLFPLLLRLYARCLRLFPFAPPEAALIRRIVIFSVLGPGLRTGDYVAASIAVNLIARRFPNASLHLVTSRHEARSFGELYLRHTAIDALIVCDLPAGPWSRNRFALWRELRRGKFHACVQDTRDTTLSPLFAHLCGIRYRIGVHRGMTVDDFLNPPRGVNLAPEDGTTLLDMATAYARALAFEPPLSREQIEPRFELAPLAQPHIAAVQRPLIALHAGGAPDWNRRWPEQHFVALCELLIRECGAHIVVLGGEHERDEAEHIVRAVRARHDAASIRNDCGGDLNTLAQRLAAADLLVANDSAVMHVAAGLGVPAVVMFGPTTHAIWDAYRLQSNVSLELDCWQQRPALGRDLTVACGHQCPVRFDATNKTYPYCMRHLAVDTVFQECRRRLAGLPTIARAAGAARAAT